MRKGEALEVLHDVSNCIAEIETRMEIVRGIVDVLEVRGFELPAVLRKDPFGDTLSPIALGKQGNDEWFRAEDMARVSEHDLRTNVGVTGWVAKVGRSLRLDDVSRAPQYYGLRDDICSELCVPIRFGGQVLGVLNTETTRKSAYKKSDERFLEIVASQLGSVMAECLTREGSVGVLSICSYCKNLAIGEDWFAVEHILSQLTAHKLSHGICPACYERKLWDAPDTATGLPGGTRPDTR